MNTLAVLGVVLGVVLGIIVVWGIGYVRTNNILGKRAMNNRATQNLCSKYNPHVVRGKDGRFKSVLSPHIKKV